MLIRGDRQPKKQKRN